MFHTKAKRYNFAIQKNKKKQIQNIIYNLNTNKQNAIQIDTNTLI